MHFQNDMTMHSLRNSANLHQVSNMFDNSAEINIDLHTLYKIATRVTKKLHYKKCIKFSVNKPFEGVVVYYL